MRQTAKPPKARATRDSRGTIAEPPGAKNICHHETVALAEWWRES
jgi:hypothetical protein